MAGFAAVAFGVSSSLCHVGRAKGLRRFAAYCMFASVFFFLGFGEIYRNLMLPVFEATGVIVSARLRSSGRSHRTDLFVRTEAADVISLHASGRNDGFRVGEHVAVKYQGLSGAIIRADFTSPEGKPDGTFASGLFYAPALPLGAGILVFFAARRQYKSDPLGEVDHRGLRRRADLRKLRPT